ncbi:restriction endonuclease subunit S [Candidatus Poriferisodalis sp.]|uniref:restriction endonuclease subunit S n=1 Tax=Candidatus Poriferisodalis sp. TaxID=3101277 RepID=UPI003B029279
MTTDLPPGWTLTTLGQVFEIVGGATPSTKEPSYWGGDIPWLTPDDLASHDGVEVAGGRRSITAEGYDSTSTHLLPMGAVLFSSRAPIGYTAIAAQPLCTNQGFKSLIPPEGVDSRWAYWYLRHATPLIREMGSGTTFKEMSKKRMANVPFVLAPIREQRRIVAAIEEHFSRLDATDSGLAAAILRTTQLQQHVVDDQLRLADVRSQPLSGFLTERLANGRSVPTAASSGDPVLRLTALKDGFIDPSETKQGDFGDTDPRRFAIAPDDFLISRGNGSLQLVGRGGLVLKAAPAVAFPDTMIRARVDKSRLSPRYLSLVWHSRQVRRQLETQARTTAGIYKVNQSMIGAVEFPVPALDVQRQLVQVVEEARLAVRSIAASLNRCQATSSALRRSILSQAFSGQLTPQGLGDESSSAMLGRVGAGA